MILHERSFFEANFKPLPAPPRPPSISGTSVRSSSYENVSLEWRQYVKSTLKQYVSASGQGVTHDSVECPQLEDGDRTKYTAGSNPRLPTICIPNSSQDLN